MLKDKACEFCERSDHSVIGPFLDYVNFNEYYFHPMCLQCNDYVIANKDNKKQPYLNIHFALEQLKYKDSQICQRCFLKGATISCYVCKTYFHGNVCSQLRMLDSELDDSKQTYKCF